ncbi:MAG TPA: M3 family metallopeptidase, partial [Gaiellaceae bacterium]|nr:M3 family metallopeptidase [Gaiellaceae bacterium]
MTTTELTGAEDVAWDLSDLYESGHDPRIEQHVREVEEAAAAFRERYYGRIAELSAAELVEAIDERERIDSIFTRAIYYAHLWFSTDMADSQRGALLARLTEKGAVIETQLLFFGLELADLDDAQADALLADTTLERWDHWLRSVRKFRPYILTEPEEKIMTEKSVSGVSAWDRLYDELLGALKVDLDGAEISFEEAMAKLYSGDRDERRRASEAVTIALEPGLRTRTFIFNTIVVDKSIDDRLRGYENWLSARNLRNDTTDEAVRALVDAAVSRYDFVQRYYRLKARLIGLDRLSFYDRMAPIGEDPTKSSWAEASQIVLDAYADFSSDVGDIVQRFFRESWIDAPVRENKRPGAFCATTVPGVHPYVFMNFTGERRSILTLAHELGHGLHGYLAQPLGLYNANTPLTTAETASVFGEALTFKRLLAIEDDPGRRLNLLAGRIEDS